MTPECSDLKQRYIITSHNCCVGWPQLGSPCLGFFTQLLNGASDWSCLKVRLEWCPRRLPHRAGSWQLAGSRELSEDVNWSLSGVSEWSLGFHSTVAAFWAESWQEWKKEAETAHPLTSKPWNWSSVFFRIFYWGQETQACPDWSQ